MKIRILDNGFEKHSDLLKRVIEERIPYETADNGMRIELCELYHTNRELGHAATYPPVQGRQAVLNARKTLKY